MPRRRLIAPLGLLLPLTLALLGCDDKPDAATLVKGMKAQLKLPTQVDEDTQLDDVRALSPTELGYFLTLTRMTKARADTRPVAATLEKQARSTACSNANYKQLFAAGFSVRIVYQTQDHVELLQVLLTPKDCGL